MSKGSIGFLLRVGRYTMQHLRYDRWAILDMDPSAQPLPSHEYANLVPTILCQLPSYP